MWISWVIPNSQVIQGSYKDAHWYSEPKARKNILATKYLKWKRQNNLNGKIFQQTKYLPFRRTGFQPQTQDSLRVCWVWTSFHNFTSIWEWWKTHWNLFPEKIARLLDWTLGEGPCDSIRCKIFLVNLFSFDFICHVTLFLQDALF